MKVTNCSMSCMYAEGSIDTCDCVCKGSLNGLMTNMPVAVKCTPSVEKRCKAGHEGGECECACGGVNHGLYQTISDFDAIKITNYAAA